MGESSEGWAHSGLGCGHVAAEELAARSPERGGRDVGDFHGQRGGVGGSGAAALRPLCCTKAAGQAIAEREIDRDRSQARLSQTFLHSNSSTVGSA